MPSYFEKTEGYITASKLKDFMKCERFYYLKWIKGLAKEEKTTDALEFGNLLDAFVTLGEDKFWEQYTILEPRKSRKSEFDIRNSDGEKLLAMIEEIKRQPLFMDSNDYAKQELITCEYKGLKLSGRLDRYSKEKKVIRDTKSCRSHTGEFHYSDSFHNQAFQFDYPFSMSFYAILAKIRDGVECEVGLDVFAKNNGLYQLYMIPPEIINPEKHRIIKQLDKLANKKTEEDYQCEAEYDKCLRCPLATKCSQTIQTNPEWLESPSSKY